MGAEYMGNNFFYNKNIYKWLKVVMKTQSSCSTTVPV